VSSKPDSFLPQDQPLRRFLDEWAPKAMWLGVFGVVITLAYLIWAAIQATSPAAGMWQPDDVARISSALGLAGKGFFVSALLVGVCVALQWFDEVSVGPLLLFLAALMFWGVPMFLMMGTEGHAVTSQVIFSLALSQIRLATVSFVGPGIVVIIYAAVTHTYTSGTVGVKRDQLEYGKDVKEEKEVVNKFLGKCWQLPYCRKFIRLRCPIYLSRKCCWRERVGCMCEETVIRGAMEGTVKIPKDPRAAAQYIPYNKTLTSHEKSDRCRNCIIYTEHQRQKYRLVAPFVIFGTVGPVVFWHDWFVERFGFLLDHVEQTAGRFSLATSDASHGSAAIEVFKTSSWAAEILIACTVLIVLAYLLRFVEYALFKLKI
jgi:hypothetical protein